MQATIPLFIKPPDVSDANTPASQKPGLLSHWPSWLGFGLIRLLIRLPHGRLLALSRMMGGLFYLLARRRRRIAEINLQICFPEMNEQQRRHLLRDHFSAMVMGMFEMGMAWWLPEERLARMLTLEGKEHLETALAQGKGAILLSAHFTCLELSGRFYTMTIPHPWSGMYRPHENPVVEYLFQRDRKRFFSELIPRDDIRAFLRRLKANEPVWYAPDQNYRYAGHVKAPFFGVPAPTSAATARLARISGAPVIPFEYRRLPGSDRYLMQFHPPLVDFPGDDDLAATTRINHVFEEMIRRAPEQYFWMHRRFKYRRREQMDVYRAQGIGSD
jgi:KDO2-lipid IV(A) lauroyltransferase